MTRRHRTPCLAVTVALLVAPLPGTAATVTRTEDQRLVEGAAPAPQGHFGSRVVMSRSRVETFALVAGNGAGATVNRFPYVGAGWQWQSTSSWSSAQSLPMDHEAGWGLFASLEANGETWVRRQTYTELSGKLLELVADNEVKALAYYPPYLALGIPDANLQSGVIVIYEQHAVLGDWSPVAYLFGQSSGDRLGAALAAKDGIVVAGAPGYGANGAVFLYICCDFDGQWLEWQRLDSPAISQAGAEFGAALDIAGDGSWIAVGSPLVDRVITPGERVDVGAVYLYEHVGFSWDLETLLRPPGAADDDHFGTSVAMHRKFLVGGSPGEDGAEGDEGAAYVYHLAGTAWETVPRLRLADSAAEEHDALGTSVAAGDTGVLVGAPFFDGNDVFDAGAVLFYANAGAFFDDGFEGGDSSAWSLTVP
jgi:hypothetical protein